MKTKSCVCVGGGGSCFYQIVWQSLLTRVPHFIFGSLVVMYWPSAWWRCGKPMEFTCGWYVDLNFQTFQMYNIPVSLRMSEPRRLLPGTDSVWPGLSIIFKTKYRRVDTLDSRTSTLNHDGVINWKHFMRYWPFVRGIHQSPVYSPHKGQWRRVVVFSLICAWINGWVNIREAGDLRRHRSQYDVTVMWSPHFYPWP